MYKHTRLGEGPCALTPHPIVFVESFMSPLPQGPRKGEGAITTTTIRYSPFFGSTNCVCVTIAASRPSPRVIFVCHTIVVRPR